MIKGLIAIIVFAVGRFLFFKIFPPKKIDKIALDPKYTQGEFGESSEEVTETPPKDPFDPDLKCGDPVELPTKKVRNNEHTI